MELTPDDHRQVRATAYLMWRRVLAGWGSVDVPSGRRADEMPQPPNYGPHRTSHYYTEAEHRARQEQRRQVVAKATRRQQ